MAIFEIICAAAIGSGQHCLARQLFPCAVSRVRQPQYVKTAMHPRIRVVFFQHLTSTARRTEYLECIECDCYIGV